MNKTNKVTKIEDSVSDPTYNGCFNFADGASQSNEYTYDQNGNLTKDLNKKISSIQYNLLNLPQSITYSTNKSATYTYDAKGNKLRVVYTNPSSTIDYCGNMIYEGGALKQILVDGGYVTLNGTTPVYHYYLQDHLGNNRVVCNASSTVEQVNHYYPFGGLFGESTNGDTQRYKYNGKELDRMHGLDWYDYGARHMAPDASRFTTIDPMTEKYYNMSPSAYCGNNPINAIDPDGKKSYLIVWKTNNEHYGHAAFAVDNYKPIKNNSEGEQDILYQPDGTVTLYGLFPINSYGKDEFNWNKTSRGLFLINRKTTLDEIQNNPLHANTGEDYAPDGIIQINSSYQSDEKAKSVMEKEIHSNKHYKGQTRNCASFAKEGVKATSGQKVDGQIFWIDAPNSLFLDTKKLDNIIILKDNIDKK